MGNRKPIEIAPGVYWYAAGAVAGNIYSIPASNTVTGSSRVVNLNPLMIGVRDDS